MRKENGRGQFSLESLTRRKVPKSNVAKLLRRIVFLERNLAKAFVSFVDFTTQSLKTLTSLWNVLVPFSWLYWIDPGMGKEVGPESRGCRQGIPIASSSPPALTLPSSAPGLNKSRASQLGWRLSKVFCPHFLAIILLWGDEKALEVPSYLLRKCGVFSWEQSPQTFCDGKHCGSELLPCPWFQSDLGLLLLLYAPQFPHL